jgi:PAS domain S-box-containing protein
MDPQMTTREQLIAEAAALRLRLAELEASESEIKRANDAFLKTHRALKVLSQCNNALVHATEELDLLHKICRIIVEAGQYRLSWVGFAEQDEARTVNPVAQAGYEEGYLETLKITWADAERGRGPTGRAIRTGKFCIARDILNDPNFTPWRAEALKRGYASSIALPLTTEDRALGALNIYAGEPHAFDEEEVNLLTELAGNLAFGIMALRTRIERKEAEESRKRSEARYRAIVEDQTELICRHLPDGTFTFVNEAYCRYFGRKREDLMRCSSLSFVHDEDRVKVEQHRASLSPGNPVATIEHRVVAPGREVRWQQWTSRIILDEQNRFIEFQSVGRDITERKLMEEALAKSAEQAMLFAYSVSHDLKSPAIGIHGLTRLLHKHYRNTLDESGMACCDQILRASEHLMALIEKINVYIETKESPLKIEKIDVKEILQIVREEFSAPLSARRIEWLEPERLTKIRADRISMLRVFRNFVDNALKYGGDILSRIRIGYSESEELHIFSVNDDGAGIRSGDYVKIFGLFQREEARREIRGAGLGLAIVSEIAEQHKGKVWAEPGQDRGTTFYISISKYL